MIIIIIIAIFLTVIVVEKIIRTTIYPKSQLWYFNHHFQLQFCIWQFWNCAWSGLNSFEYLINGRLIDWNIFVFMKTIIIFIIIITIIFTIITSLSRWSRLGEKKLSHLQKIFRNGSLLLPRLTPEDSGAIPDKDLQQTLSFNINGENFEMVPCSCQGLTQRTQVCL